MLTIRTAEAEDAARIANVHVKTWHATYSGLLPKSYIDSFTEDRRAIAWVRIMNHMGKSEGVLVSENLNGEIVGFVSYGPLRSVIPGHEGEISSLYILPGFQREGHGRRLFLAASNRLHQAGLEGLAIWVLRDNPADMFYKRMGGTVVSSRTSAEADVELDEIAYGWEKIPSYG
ncbi:MAG: GNAT family N-acetyltransferase [Rhodospirillaceae bacterium]